MPTVTVKEASAASVVGTNMMSGNRVQVASTFRRVRRLGVVGSAAAGDSSVDLFYGSVFVGNFFNTTAGADKVPTNNVDMIPVTDDNIANPGDPINLLISDAGATNILVATLEIEESPAAF